MLATKLYKCDTCQLNIERTQASILCKSCDLWYHAQCAKINDQALSLLKDNKSLSFTCEKCESNPTSELERMLLEEIRGLNFKIEKEDDLNSIKNAFTEAVANSKTEVSSCHTNLQSDIKTCSKQIQQIDASTSAKISHLEEENNILHKRLYRGDIVISGLPDGLSDLVAPVISLCSHFDETISSTDIKFACYMFSRKVILVKFNNVFLRDRLMKAYFKTRTLKYSDVMGGDIETRIYLHDHYSPAAGKLNFLCRRLLRQKLITKFRLLNSDIIKVKLTLPSGNEVIYGAEECAGLLNVDHNNDAAGKP